MTKIDVDSSNPNYYSYDNVLFTKDKAELIQCPGGKSGSYMVPSFVSKMCGSAFEGCTSLTSITIPNSVTSISGKAFCRCTSLTSITIPNSVTSIGYNAFYGCKSLTSITIPNSVTSIGFDAFDYCTSLTSITIPNSVTSIGTSVFLGCTSLTKIDVDSSNPNYCSYDNILFTKDKSELIQCPGGRSGDYTIPNSVTSIGNYAFEGCRSLTSITIPNSVTSIGWCAFSGCTSLTSITIPNSVTSIGDSAFSCCSLTFIAIPNSVTSIADHAFSSCASLTSITIPNSVTSIGECAFLYCESLTSITISNSLTSIGWRAFYPFGFYESNGIDNIEPTAENLAGYTFINKSGKMVKQEQAPPSVTTYTVTFRVNGNVIDTISYNDGDTSITEPKIPIIKGYDARWPQYTLSGDITVDAILVPKEYKVIYKVDGNVTFTESHKYDTKVTVRNTYNDGKHTYTPWTTNDVIVTNNTFTMIDSDVTFNSTSSAVKYTFIVKYVDTDGKEIRPQYRGEARCEAIISPDIPSISGYRSPDERISIKITEDPSKNVVIYTYSLEDVETEGSSGFPMTYVIVGAIVAVIVIAAIAFVIKKH